MQNGEYNLGVDVWITNGRGEFLISKRAPDKTLPDLWHTTGGCAVTGEDGLSAALRETLEELGIALSSANGCLFKRLRRPYWDDPGGFFSDVWLFRQDVDISAVVCQPEEISAAMWADKNAIKRMMDDGAFVSRKAYPYIDLYPYIDELFDFALHFESGG
ncbi:MAG: NUDIX domain-containing protein [Firmicutes bacterium]|nr:NUDIX domain-containing protein [Bacillota bacterium]